MRIMSHKLGLCGYLFNIFKMQIYDPAFKTTQATIYDHALKSTHATTNKYDASALKMDAGDYL